MIRLKTQNSIIITACLFGFSLFGFSQQPSEYKLSIDEAIELGLQYHQQLKISQASISASSNQIEVSKLQRLPSVTFSANAAYIGDALILDKDFSKVQTVDMPHFGNSFSIQASQLLFKGGVVKKSVEMAELQHQLAKLDLATDKQDIKFLIVSNVLDIQTLINQLKVLEQNKLLAQQLLANMQKLYEQNMVTRNEVIRSELQIKNYDQSILTIKNNHAILSNQLSYALGLPNDILIIPEDSINGISAETKDYYLDLAYDNHPALLSSQKNVEIAEKNIEIIKTDYYPSISAFGGYNMQRPITTSTPAMDMYTNSWQVGLTLSYNLDNLFKTKKKVNLGKSQSVISKEASVYTQQQIEIGINAAFVKYQEAAHQAILMEEARILANENYEIIRAKYLNQLAITADMTDASNAKLEADLQFANATINVLFQYYNLLKSTGTL